MYVGTLTADEVASVGGMYEKNLYYYLINDYQKNTRDNIDGGLGFWTLSPYCFLADYSTIYTFYVEANGQLNNGSLADHSGGDLRPLVQLKSDVQISDGNGRKENPYVVQ